MAAKGLGDPAVRTYMAAKGFGDPAVRTYMAAKGVGDPAVRTYMAAKGVGDPTVRTFRLNILQSIYSITRQHGRPFMVRVLNSSAEHYTNCVSTRYDYCNRSALVLACLLKSTDAKKKGLELCPDNGTPEVDNNGDNLFCGRGPNHVDCPEQSFCNIDPADRFAVCCPK
ncbi:uncharacterized protein LOC124281250 [Haliotis rubra]|uniref:uncharacterized protein LOC124281250 n=1 Tax=Haliotis rubra TaxID=36100 RepID=UPI001EE5B120|nr:uncharacterized protein LOC124281250 [Haliotis rubra]